jgi:predicted TIM-barrel fold metal-dependent hydrolase
MAYYEPPLRDFPDVQFVFGHAGARDWEEAMVLCRRYRNCWLEIEGQGVYELERIIATAGSERLLFGSDYPFYPLAATLVRVLVATEGKPDTRRAIFGLNGARLLGV